MSEFYPGSTTANVTLTGLSGPSGLALDGAGDLYVANNFNGTVSEFYPGHTTADFTLSGFINPRAGPWRLMITMIFTWMILTRIP